MQDILKVAISFNVVLFCVVVVGAVVACGFP